MIGATTPPPPLLELLELELLLELLELELLLAAGGSPVCDSSCKEVMGGRG